MRKASKRSKLLRLYFLALLVASILAATLFAVGKIYGFHSTTAFWCAAMNVPGLFVAAWVSRATRAYSDSFACVFAGLGNWLFYSLLIWSCQKLKRLPKQ